MAPLTLTTLAERAAGLGRRHAVTGAEPFGDLDDEGSALLLAELGETTAENFDERMAALDAYADALGEPVALTEAEAAVRLGEVIDLTWDDRADYDDGGESDFT